MNEARKYAVQQTPLIQLHSAVPPWQVIYNSETIEAKTRKLTVKLWGSQKWAREICFQTNLEMVLRYAALVSLQKSPFDAVQLYSHIG